MKIIFLGTASSIATKNRDNTSFVILNKKESILVDCPGSIVQKLKKVNLDYTKLTKIIITHGHPDHIYGIVSLIHSQYKITKKITIYSSRTSIKIIKKLIKIFKLNTEDYPKVTFRDVFSKKVFYPPTQSTTGKRVCECRTSSDEALLRRMSPQEGVQNGTTGLPVGLHKSLRIKISAFKNKHTFNSFGINVIYKDKNIVYSSDTALTKNILPFINKNTYLIHDCTASSKFFKKFPSLYKMHTESSQLKKLILKTQPKLTIPIHFLLLEKGEFSNIKRELKTVKNLLFPKDYSLLKIT